MASRRDRLGNLIHQVNEKNKDLLYTDVLGVAIEKEFMPSVANLIGTDLSKYNVVRKGRFAFNPMHVGRDEKLPIALYKNEIPALISPAYIMFEINDEKELLPDYLNLITKTDYFDHICWYHTDASVRGGLIWSDFENIHINLPSTDRQRKIVHDFNVLNDRIELLKTINMNLEEQIKTIIRNSIDEDGKSVLLENYCDIFTGRKDVNEADENGKYNFYSCSPEPVKSNEFIYSGEAILVAGNGSYTGRTIYVDDTFDLYQRTYAIVSKEKNSNIFYILYALLQTIFQDSIESKLHGSAIPYIVYDDIAKLEAKIKGDLDSLGTTIKCILKSEQTYKNEIALLKKVKAAILESLSWEV